MSKKHLAFLQGAFEIINAIYVILSIKAYSSEFLKKPTSGYPGQMAMS
jgi:hypothetical protein